MKQRQAGQALPLGLALLMISVLGGLLLYNTGQTASTKTRLVNTADAAVYSGLQWQARALNFAGYTNRAMVANQVSLAQAVSLTSWTSYGVTMGENLSTVLSGVPILNAISKGIETVMQTISTIIEPIAQSMLTVISGVNQGVAVAQEAMYQSSYLATPEIVEAVVKQSDDRFTSHTAFSTASMLNSLNDWHTFSEQIGNEREDFGAMRERADIIRDSRDTFSRARDWSFFSGFLYIGPFFKIDLVKEGETRLVERVGENGLEWEWKGKDTLSLQTRIRIPFKGWKRIEAPIGYGQAIANNSPDISIEEGACTHVSQYRRCKRWGDLNRTAEKFSDLNVRSLRGGDSRIQMSGYQGLNTFRRLSEETIDGNFPRLKLRVEVKAPLENLDSSNEFLADKLLETPHTMPGEIMSALSVAEVYFKPPDVDHVDQQGKDIEFANLYSPWWDVRLAPVSQAERLAAFTLRPGVDGLSEIPGSLPNVDASGNILDIDVQEEASAAVDTVLEDIESAAVQAGEDVLEAAKGAFGDAAQSAGDAIKESLNEALETAVADILNGILGATTGGSVSTEDVENWASGIAAQSSAAGSVITDNINDAVADVNALQDEFERLDAVISERFSEVFAAELADYRARTGGLRSRVSGYLGRPVGLFERVHDSLLSDHERDDARELQDELNRFIADLAAAYRDIVNEETDAFEMSFAMARDFVITALASYESNDGEVNWELFGSDPVDESMISEADAEVDDSAEDENEEEGDV